MYILLNQQTEATHPAAESLLDLVQKRGWGKTVMVKSGIILAAALSCTRLSGTWWSGAANFLTECIY